MLNPNTSRTLTVIYATNADVDRLFEQLPSAELIFPRGGSFQMRLRTPETIAWAEAAIADPAKQGLSNTCTLELSNSRTERSLNRPQTSRRTSCRSPISETRIVAGCCFLKRM